MLLETKFMKPISPPALLARERLIGRLGEPKGGQLTLIHASLGYGKTTLIRQWLSTLNHAAVWLSLDERDNELLHFWRYIIGAFQQFEKNSCNESLRWVDKRILEQRVPERVDNLVAAFANDLMAYATTVRKITKTGSVVDISAESPLIFVLDDYHCIHVPAIHESLSYFLDRLPPLIHVVIASRGMPPLAIPRRKVRCTLTEVSSNELAFLPDETKSYCREVLGLNATQEYFSILQQRTEGWAAALQLAVASIQDASHLQSTKCRFTEAINDLDESVRRYLFDEVICALDEDLKDFLVNLSTLECFSEKLLDAMPSEGMFSEGMLGEGVFGKIGSAKLIALLKQKNLFIHSHESKTCWYRFHKLFRQALLVQFNEKNIIERNRIHSLAGQSLEKINHKEEAINHYIMAQQWDKAAVLIEEIGYNCVLASEKAFIETWLDKLPVEQLNARPTLLLIKAWSLFRSNDITQVEEYFNQLENLLSKDELPVDAEEREKLKTQLMLYRIQLSRITGNEFDVAHRTKEFTDGAAKLSIQMDPVAQLGVVLDHYMRGDMYGVCDVACCALKKAKRQNNQFMALTLSQLLSVSLFYSGRLPNSLTVLSEIDIWLQAVGQNDNITVGFSNIALLEIYREANQIEKAKQCWDRLQHFMKTDSEPAQNALINIAYANVLIVEKKFSEAKALLDVAQEVFSTSASFWAYVAPSIPMIRAKIALMENNSRGVSTWENEVTQQLRTQPEYNNEEQRLLLARIYIRQSKGKEAMQLLTAIIAETKKNGRLLNQVRALLLLSMLKQSQGQNVCFRQTLLDALSLGWRSGYCRVFLDDWPVIEPMLYKLRRVEPALLGFIDSLAEQSQVRWADGESRASIEEHAKLRDSLTPRQLEMIWLINQGLKNYEIADRLSIAPNTAKAHIRNLFDKLKVKSRTQALSKARQIGIFSVKG